MSLEAATIEDCLDMKKYKDKSAVINDGKLIDFIYEKSTEPDNQSDQC